MHLINQFERMESRSLSAICELVRSKKEWSKYVDDIWQDAFKGICELPYVKEVERDVFCVANTEDFVVIFSEMYVIGLNLAKYHAQVFALFYLGEQDCSIKPTYIHDGD